jgi:uncharacterized membrane protein
MQTPASETAGGRRSIPLTPALGLGVLIASVVFAFDSAWYTHWYALFRVVHVMLAVIWVGGAVLITVLALRAERARDADELATIARQAAFAGERIFAPAGGIVFLMGIAMMINTDWGWGKFWVDAGLVGYASTFITGIAVLSPMAKQIQVSADEKGPEHPDTVAIVNKILLIARVDIAVLLLVIADMVTKPFS